MNCNQVVSENVIERYLDGKLDEPTRDAFELHYFGCEACLEMLQTVQTVRPVVAAMPAPAPETQPRTARRTQWVWLAAAAAVAVALLNIPSEQPKAPVATTPPPATAPPVVAVLSLADIQPAPYSPALFRGDAPSAAAAFEKAMLLYKDRNWAGAAAALSALAERPPHPPAALHFSGISLLLDGKTTAAIAALDRVIGLGAKSPFEEEARFYRAQALVLDGQTAEARAELTRLVAAQGDYESKARALLERL